MNHEKCVRARGVEGERARLTWSVLVLIGVLVGAPAVAAAVLPGNWRPPTDAPPARGCAAPEADLPPPAAAPAVPDGGVPRRLNSVEDVGWAVVSRPNATNLSASALPLRRTSSAQPERQGRVKRALQHAWAAYVRHAWGEDEVDPVRQIGIKSFGMATTLVDSLDTLHLLGLDAEFRQAVAWVAESLHFGEQEDINVFEVTIRVLGGLLSAYELSDEPILLERAEQLANQLLFAFQTPTGLPFGTVGLRSRTRHNPTWSKGASTVAEVATLQLEFRVLSRHTSNAAFEVVAQRVMRHLRQMPWPADLPRGLYPTFISPTTGDFASAELTLGARADSLYEYLLKQWLLSGRTDTRVRRMYDESVAAIRRHLVRFGGDAKCSNCTYIGQWNYKTKVYVDKMDHLCCFAPGMLALGAWGETADDDLHLAEELMKTCYAMYSDQPTGLAPEIASIRAGASVFADHHSKHNLLRPETVESLFLLWRLTGKPRYREWGWNIFLAFERHCRVSSGGYSGLKDVSEKAPRFSGKMESFFTAETLKYLWLLFADEGVMPLDDFVFNTEAHPLRVHPEYQWGAEYGSLPEESTYN